MESHENLLDLKRSTSTSGTIPLFHKRQKTLNNSSPRGIIKDNIIQRGGVPTSTIKDIQECSVLLQKMIEIFGDDAYSRTFGDLLLSLSVPSESTTEQIQDLVVEEATVGTSLLALDNFLVKGKPEHNTYCHNIDKLWNAFIKELDAKSSGQVKIKELSKPSGPLAYSHVTVLFSLAIQHYCI
jgi:hypothetical protein